MRTTTLSLVLLTFTTASASAKSYTAKSDPRVAAAVARLKAEDAATAAQNRATQKRLATISRLEKLGTDRFMITNRGSGEETQKLAMKVGRSFEMKPWDVYTFPKKGNFFTKPQADKVFKSLGGYPFSIEGANEIVNWVGINQAYEGVPTQQGHGGQWGPL